MSPPSLAYIVSYHYPAYLREAAAMIKSIYPGTKMSQRRLKGVFDRAVIAGFVLYLFVSMIMVFKSGGEKELESRERFQVSMPVKAVEDFEIEICSTSGIRQSFLDLFPGVHLDTMEFVLKQITKGMLDFEGDISSKDEEIFERSFESDQFMSLYNTFISAQRRNISTFAKGNPNINAYTFTMPGSSSEESRDWSSPEEKKRALPFLKSTGAFDEDEIVTAFSSLNSWVDLKSVEVERAGKGTKGRVCHIVRHKRKGNTAGQFLAESRARLLLDTEAYDTARGSRFLSAATVGLLRIREVPVAVLRPGGVRRLDTWMSPGFDDFDDGETGNLGARFPRVDVDYSVRDDGQGLKAEALTDFEVCRLYRQLSKRCLEGDLRREALERFYPRLCQNQYLLEFYTGFRFKQCLDMGPQIKITDNPPVAKYAEENLTLILFSTHAKEESKT